MDKPRFQAANTSGVETSPITLLTSGEKKSKKITLLTDSNIFYISL